MQGSLAPMPRTEMPKQINLEDIGWVIDVRNNEIPEEFREEIKKSPGKFSWDVRWYVIDEKAFERQSAELLVSRAMELWEPMTPTDIEECTQLVVKLAKDFNSRTLHRSTPIVEWRLRNVFTGEEIPGVIFEA